LRWIGFFCSDLKKKAHAHELTKRDKTPDNAMLNESLTFCDGNSFGQLEMKADAKQMLDSDDHQHLLQLTLHWPLLLASRAPLMLQSVWLSDEQTMTSVESAADTVSLVDHNWNGTGPFLKASRVEAKISLRRRNRCCRHDKACFPVA